jgi:hypothetical protein
MREVRTCDFCGDEAAGTYEIVPPESDPDGEGRRLVLCAGCRETLASVLEPLLDGERADAASGEETGPTTVVAEPERESESGPQAGPGTDATADGASAANDGDVGDASAGESAGGEERLGEAFGGGTDGEAAGGDGDGSGGRETRGRSTAARRGTPRGYRKVMRFLENREFPMDREEAETLAAEAYGLDPESVTAAVDHAIKHDRLREVSGDIKQ